MWIFEAKRGVNETFLQQNSVYVKILLYLCSRITQSAVILPRGVAQLVAHLVWDQVVARSSRVTPTAKG